MKKPLLLLSCALILGAVGGPARAALPAGFVDELVTEVGAPTAFAFTPDGRLLITTKEGQLRVRAGGVLLATPAISFSASSICTESERGLLGVAVDPSFASNNFIYLFRTFESPACVNRVSRFTLPASNVINPASELVLVDNMPSPAGNHNAGDVAFGKDGFLYISIGDGGCDYNNDSGCAGQNDAARDMHVLTGKILRVTSTGGIPASNPFQGAGTATCNVTGQTTAGTICREIFATGLRNPFRIAFDPNAVGTRFFINDVGQGLWEEVDEGQAGGDYGWNVCEGNHPNSSTSTPCTGAPPGHVAPLFDYRHGLQVPGTSSPTNCNSITGGAFVPDGLWPGMDGSYLLSDFICGWILRITESAGVWSAIDFATQLGGSSATHLAFGPDDVSQSLYYATFAGGGQIRRIRQAPANALHTITPCRIVDTRGPAGPLGGPALQGSQTRRFALAGACGIPPSARAVSVNLTVVSPSSAGSLRAKAAGASDNVTSVLSFGAGQTRAGMVTLGLVNGAVDVSALLPAGQTAHFVLDVTGYFGN